MVDDFHGTYEWEVFAQGIKKVFPDRPIVDIEDDHAIFSALLRSSRARPGPGRQFVYSGRTYERDGFEPKWRAIFDDKGRIQVAICHNMDLGDAWEWADFPDYPGKVRLACLPHWHQLPRLFDDPLIDSAKI